MANASSIHTGWHYDAANARLDFYFRGTRVGHIDATGLTVVGATLTAVAATLTGTLTAVAANFSGLVTAAAGLTVTGALRTSGAANFGFGAGEAVTIASGVATITKPHVILDAEGAGTTDQLDTITYANAAAGDLLLLTANATDTITVDDANIDLGAATRAIAPGGSLLLRYDGASWVELAFLTAADNV